ncbi:MAG: biopolymer transporter ExbD [Thermoguttaceae bacterium]|nr:biopolymer transporter ExbD [Thermoguttaceae bacterium]MDW8077718.1 biopolymer transporter ExbD [Thermoguttaceae bacterium]
MSFRNTIEELPNLNLTPMIDVVFLLIIFFMLATKFTEIERKLELRIPEVAYQEMLVRPPDPKVITVYRDGSIAYEKRILTLDELKENLKSARTQFPKLSVLIRGDMEVQFQRIADVLSICKQVQIPQVSVAVRPKEDKTLPR